MGSSMRVEYVTHASILCHTTRGRLLTDPYVLLDPWESQVATMFPPRKVDLKKLGTLRWVFISHEHSDHAHLPTLTALKDNGQLGTILIPAGRPALKELVGRLHHDDVVELPHGELVKLAGGVQAAVLLHPNDVDSTLLFEANGQSLAACSDCILPLPIAERAAELMDLDVAFVPHTTAQDLHPWVMDLPQDTLVSMALAREKAELTTLVAHAHALGAKLTVPYAFTLAYRYPDQQHLNTVGHTLPEEFAHVYAQAFPNEKSQVMWPGDVLHVDTGDVRKARLPEHMDGSLPGFQHALADQLAAHPPPPWDAGSPLDAKPWLSRHFSSGVLSAPGLRRVRGHLVHLILEGRSTQSTWTIPLGGEAAVEGARGNPSLIIRMPPSLVAPVLDGSHDPFMALYTYRVRFKWPSIQLGSPAESTGAAVEIFVRLFTPRKRWFGAA